MAPPLVFRGQIVLPDRIARGAIVVREERIAELQDRTDGHVNSRD